MLKIGPSFKKENYVKTKPICAISAGQSHSVNNVTTIVNTCHIIKKI